MNPVVHFEIPANDVTRAKAFYENLFGWKFEFYPQMEYYGIKARKDGVGIDGGLMKRKMPGQPFMNYIMVDSVDKTLAQVVKAGGKVAMPKTPIGDMGAIAAFIDPESNIIGLHEMSAKMKATQKVTSKTTPQKTVAKKTAPKKKVAAKKKQ